MKSARDPDVWHRAAQNKTNPGLSSVLLLSVFGLRHTRSYKSFDTRTKPRKNQMDVTMSLHWQNCCFSSAASPFCSLFKLITGQKTKHRNTKQQHNSQTVYCYKHAEHTLQHLLYIRWCRYVAFNDHVHLEELRFSPVLINAHRATTSERPSLSAPRLRTNIDKMDTDGSLDACRLRCHKYAETRWRMNTIITKRWTKTISGGYSLSGRTCCRVATQQSHVLCPQLHLHSGCVVIQQVDIWKEGEGGTNAKKSWPSSFAGVTWRVVGCIVCWTCVIAFVERLTENTQCGARPCLPETASVLVGEPPRGEPLFPKRVPLQPPPGCRSSIQPTDLNLLRPRDK